MALPDYNMRQLLEAGVHFGHQTHAGIPKWLRFIFGERNGIHVLICRRRFRCCIRRWSLYAMWCRWRARAVCGTKRQAAEPCRAMLHNARNFS
ncbi:MAG: hypothetical protein CM15mP21_3290 [Hyphomicrobiales bacterium]|nr:MAG: hypothetical protein CM15mP21_3290 [Hyphomicrobiales bacterium]